MNRFVQLVALTGIIASSFAFVGCSSTQNATMSSKNGTHTANSPGSLAQIYMFRGGFIGVFSTGITDMANQLRQRGVPAQDLSWAAGNASLEKIKKAIAANPKARPIILAGHSLGATSVVGMARALTRENIVVDLVVVFDSLGSSTVPKGVRKLISFKASGDRASPGSFHPGRGFTGQIINIDVRNLPDLERSSHWNIVNQGQLQERVVREIESTYRRYH